MQRITHSDPPKNLIIFGGTFDPIHKGHLHIAAQVQARFGFDRFVFLPCKAPLLKKPPVARSLQRIEMLKRALTGQPPYYAIDDTEMVRETPSYMVETLHTFRKRYGATTPIALLLGVDTFLQLPQWHHWQETLELANLCVVNRPHTQPEDEWSSTIKSLLLKHETESPKSFLEVPFGLIYRYNAGSCYISSTKIREELGQGKIPRSELPPLLIEYIQEQKLYLPTAFEEAPSQF